MYYVLEERFKHLIINKKTSTHVAGIDNEFMTRESSHVLRVLFIYFSLQNNLHATSGYLVFVAY